MVSILMSCIPMYMHDDEYRERKTPRAVPSCSTWRTLRGLEARGLEIRVKLCGVLCPAGLAMVKREWNRNKLSVSQSLRICRILFVVNSYAQPTRELPNPTRGTNSR